MSDGSLSDGQDSADASSLAFSLPIVTDENNSLASDSASATSVGDLPREKRRLPRWLKRPLPKPGMYYTSNVIEDLLLETVCESAKCPNRSECWSQQTATFMILGNVCTRPCGFCSVPKGKTELLQADEP